MAHKNPSYRDREAVAPYNFVPLPAKPRIAPPPLSHDRYYAQDGDRPVYSGWFDCALTTETPCFIRGPIPAQDAAEGKESKNRPDIFSLDNGKTPRIPGSSLRGLFRNLIEIIGNARLNFVADRRLVYRAVDTTRLGQNYRERIMEPDPTNPQHRFTPRVEAGYVRKGSDGEWYIQPAKKINGTTWCRISHKALGNIRNDLKPWPEHATQQNRVKNARLIYVQPGNYDFQDVRGGFIQIRYARALRASPNPSPGLRKAALIESGRINTKRSEAIIFEPDDSVPQNCWLPLRIEEEGIALDRDYRDQITDQQRAILGPNGALQDMQPVFYLVEHDRLTFFGHTLMMRLPYKKSIMEHVPVDFHAEGKLDIDLAEALFGYSRRGVNKSGESETLAFAGRLAFTDGLYRGNLPDAFERQIKPKVLSTPKPTTFQHYLCQPQPDNKDQLKHYDDDTPIRGYKLYWHHGALQIEQIEETDREKLKHATQYTDIKAVKAGAAFTFRIYFDNLRDYELGALAWLLQHAAHPDYRLKLGMGKPHGMGAVRIQSALYLVDRRARYEKLFGDEGGWQTADKVLESTDGLIQQFKSWIAQGDAAQFDAQLHIRELLAMLSWHGPDPKKTRYMEIERRQSDGRKVNEYRDRPVLPHPTAVLGRAPASATPSVAVTKPGAQTAAAPDAQPLAWRSGVVIQIRTDRQGFGKIREDQTGKEYRFEIRAIQGDTPGKNARVKFQAQGDRVVAVKKSLT